MRYLWRAEIETAANEVLSKGGGGKRRKERERKKEEKKKENNAYDNSEPDNERLARSFTS